MFPAIHDPRLVLEATTPLERRALYVAIKTCHSLIKAHLHLTPQCKANKTLVYFTTRRQQVNIDDRGDIICLSWKSDHTQGVRIEVGRSAAEVEATMATFLDAPPRPPANRIPEWRQQPRGYPPAHRAQNANGRGTRAPPKHTTTFAHQRA